MTAAPSITPAHRVPQEPRECRAAGRKAPCILPEPNPGLHGEEERGSRQIATRGVRLPPAPHYLLVPRPRRFLVIALPCIRH